MKKGLVQIYTGDGKGKTTAAAGLAIRAAGRGLKVEFLQFMKSTDSGEISFIRENTDLIKIRRFNSSEKAPWNMNEAEMENLRRESRRGISLAGDILKNGRCDILILDEVLGALNREFITAGELIKLIKEKPHTLELVLTGRNATGELIREADLVTEMKKIKHPFDRGIPAREGIER